MTAQQSPLVRRVRAANPSAMTGSGTNSYILGQGVVAVVDPGPDDPRHIAALLASLAPHETVGAIIVTHAHLDHSALAPTLAKATNAPVLAFGDAASGRSPLMQSLVASGLKGGGEGVDIGFMPDRCLTDGETVDLGALRIEVLHCPGHMGGHLCLGVGKVLLSGDHAMGWASSLISPPDGDMGAYMASLAGLAQRDWTQMLPGHGDAVGDPAARLAELAAHRRLRETQVLQALAPGPADAATLAARIYLDVAPALMPAASRNVLAHLIDLRDRNLVSSAGTLNASVVFKRI